MDGIRSIAIELTASILGTAAELLFDTEPPCSRGVKNI